MEIEWKIRKREREKYLELNVSVLFEPHLGRSPLPYLGSFIHVVILPSSGPTVKLQQRVDNNGNQIKLGSEHSNSYINKRTDFLMFIVYSLLPR